MGSIMGLNCILCWVFSDLEASYSVWWAPVLLLDIVIHFMILVQIAYEWATWDSKILNWKKEQVFDKLHLNNPDDLSEKQLMNKAESEVHFAEEALKPKEFKDNIQTASSEEVSDNAQKIKKLKLSANMYTIAYCSFMKNNK